MTPEVPWSAEIEELRALTVQQPWAWLIVNGFKDIENRTWQRKTPETILIHAGQSRKDFEERRAYVKSKQGVDIPGDLDRGGVIGMVDVLAFDNRPDSQWHEPGHVGWVLANPRRLKFRPCAGALGLFKPAFG